MNHQSRDDLAQKYFDVLPFDPYPVQEEALLAWFTEEQGVLVCAPTGMGKTLIAEAAVFEALHLGKTAYYTTPLIALTDQKFRELQQAAVKWGFSENDIGLVTGNRRVNPDAKILVVVAEILLNRLLQRDAFGFADVWAVVMDEFHSFNDPSRGIVWEFGLGLLPKQVRTLLLSATVGNALPFTRWLQQKHHRNLKLVQSDQRKIPLSYHWVEDETLVELVETMVSADEALRRTPALIFCFNREQCWTVAEQLKGKKVVGSDQQKRIATYLEQFDWSQGAGPKLKQILMRGIGVHHAGVLPRYRRIVEELFQEKLLSFCVCTETLAAGINLPARSVVLPTLLKGPPKKMKLIEPSSAHQMFGRAGRPQYDDQGFVFALPHEDDVKILRWLEKFEQIPADTKDPGLLRAKKRLKKKQPRRREGVQYWNQSQFEQLKNASPGDLVSRGPLPWRMLVYMLSISPEVGPISDLVSRRLLPEKEAALAQKQLTEMLVALHRADFVKLSPPPSLQTKTGETTATPEVTDETPTALTLDLGQRDISKAESKSSSTKNRPAPDAVNEQPVRPAYRPQLAAPTERLPDLLKLRGVHPLYAIYLMNHLGIADRTERILAIESLLELPRSLGPAIRVPGHDELPPGPLAQTRLDPQLLKLGLATSEELGAIQEGEEDQNRGWYDESEQVYVLTLAHKLLRLFEFDFPGVHDVRVWPCWVAGELLEFGDDFNLYITSKKLQKQEGMVFRHLLRIILLIDELAQLCPVDMNQSEWQDEIGEIADRLESICRAVDPYSTELWLEEARSTADDEVSPRTQ
jgi:superfamily II DNA/RNA helicase